MNPREAQHFSFARVSLSCLRAMAKATVYAMMAICNAERY
jgi:hypothetical protein